MRVGIVVPIYNVAKYLRQCLDSIIHQTYTNLEIILVDDGSTDSSLRIAKEYAQKDSRITIIHKENGGLSSARNAGIEFLAGNLWALPCHCEAEPKQSIILQKVDSAMESLKQSDIMDLRSAGKFANANVRHENQRFSRNDAVAESHTLYSYKVSGENPYQIHAIYSLKDKLEIPHIDYLQFVDSDDYIELDCVEQCIPRMQGVEVLWFNACCFYDKCDEAKHITNMEYYHYKKEQIITSKEWLRKSLEIGQSHFWYSIHGLINFEFLKSIKLKFIDNIIHEDNIFGILLFANATNIYVYPKNFYHYRIRPNSIMNHNRANLESSPPPKHLLAIYDAFERLNEAKDYYRAYSWLETALSLNEFLKHNKDKYQNKLLKKCFLKSYCLWALWLWKSPADPLGVKTKENLRFLKKNARGFINAYFFGSRYSKNNKKIVKLESLDENPKNKRLK